MEALAVVTRNEFIESIHYGYVCVVDSSGKVLYSLGDFRTKIFFRSSAKPIQVLPFIQTGAAAALGFSQKEIALACASHTGQKDHQITVQQILQRLNLDTGSLHCGTMTPYNEEENKRLLVIGESPSVLHASCSGKHAAMLALAKFKGYSLDDYEEKHNPVQQEILKTIAEFSEEAPETIPVGIDGCGVPIYLLPIHKLALSYAKLCQYAEDKYNKYHAACKGVFEAMTAYPEMVAGDKEFDTELMQITGDKLIGKIGSEAVYCLGIKKGALGVCIKIADGSERAVYPAAVQVLYELGILEESEFSRLKHWYNPVLKNNLHEEIGRIIPIFRLKEKLDYPLHLGERIEL